MLETGLEHLSPVLKFCISVTHPSVSLRTGFCLVFLWRTVSSEPVQRWKTMNHVSTSSCDSVGSRKRLQQCVALHFCSGLCSFLHRDVVHMRCFHVTLLIIVLPSIKLNFYFLITYTPILINYTFNALRFRSSSCKRRAAFPQRAVTLQPCSQQHLFMQKLLLFLLHEFLTVVLQTETKHFFSF